MKARLSIILLLGCFTLSFNFGQANDSIKTKCPFILLKVDNYNHRNIIPGDYIIKTYSDLVDYWEKAFGPLSISPLPNVYFSNQIVIVLNGDYGDERDGSKTISVFETRDKIIVSLALKEPSNRRYMSIEWKCTIIAIKKTDKTIEIKRNKT